ncbi:MAG: hypothetical protein IT366_04655 [Candidatus Hydrogenedentes bacterium]|nr:hypothetical protein [Candidatus Hydrogenedentota bacterium]
MVHDDANNLKHNLVLPTLLFASLGAMSWAVRGCSGYGGSAGCLFAGVLWGAAWWFIAREPGPVQSRRYTSGWIILALCVGFYIAGGRGWAQWWTLYEGRLQTNASKNEFVDIAPIYGYAWVFLSAVPWAGIGACMLAWCGDAARPNNGKEWLLWIAKWILRIGSGYVGARLALYLFAEYPNVFLPIYGQIEDRYKDLVANPNLRRMMNDNRSATMHLGLYLGFLMFEVLRRDWRNVTLIATVGLINGVGWALFMNFARVSAFGFNWWRVWESSGGISIGIAYGVAYYLVNRPLNEAQGAQLGDQLTDRWPNLERFGAYLGLLLGVLLSVRNGLKGWANIYLGNEDYWSSVFWRVIGPILIAAFVWLLGATIRAAQLHRKPAPVFPRAYAITWAVLIVMNILAQLVTSSPRHWTELVFAFYYLVLLGATGLIVHYYHLGHQKTAKTDIGQ